MYSFALRYALPDLRSSARRDVGGCAMLFAVLGNGAVAQLGERQNRTLEVGSSSLLCSTKFSSTAGVLSARDRQRF